MLEGLRGGLGQGRFGKVAHLPTEELDLVDGLTGAAVAFFWGSVGGEDKEGGFRCGPLLRRRGRN